VTLKDQFGNGISGKTITVAPDAGSNAEVHPFAVGGNQPGVTDTTGTAQFEASDETAEVVTFTATDTTDSNLILTQTVTITYVAGAADPGGKGSTVVASPANPPSDGTTPSTVTVTLTDIFGNPVSGSTISLNALNGKSTITAVNSVTGTNGEATFTVVDSIAEVVTYQAVDVTLTNTAFLQEATVTFGSPPAPPPVAQFCSVVVNPSTVPADGSSSATVTVLLYDGNGNAVAGKTVTLTSSGGSSTVTALNGTTDETGSATFMVTDTVAESVTYTAADTSDSVSLSDDPVTIKFTTATGGSTTTTTTPPGTTSGSSTTTTMAATSGSAAATTTATPTTATTTTTSASATLNSPSAGDNPSSDGSTAASSATSEGSDLAFTGSSSALLWLFGSGAICVVVGTIGRRRLRVVPQ
jgi:adhesin/invasin